MGIAMNILIFVFLIILIFILFFALGGTSRSRVRAGKWSQSSRWVKPLLGMYGLILFSSLILFYVVPSVYGFTTDGDVGEERENYMELYSEFYHAADKGRLEEMEAVHTIEKWEFEYHGSDIKVTDARGEQPNMAVWVQIKDHEDGIIEAAFYTTGNVVNGFDFTHEIRPPIIEQRGDRLIVTKPEPYKIEYFSYTKEFTIRQFYGPYGLGHSSGSLFGPDILFLKIPKNIQIDSDNYKIHVIEEKLQ